jgi:hypothetical protein
MKRNNKIYELSIAIIGIALLTTITFLNLEDSIDSVNEITGNVVSRVNVSPMREVPCNFTLYEGANLVSFFCITFEAARNDITTNITSLYGIFEYQKGSADKWKSYNPSLPSWVVQDLNVMSRTRGYWVIVNSTGQIIVPGGVRIPTNIPVTAGWNLVGYPTNETKTVNQSFLSIAGNFTEAREFDPISKTYQNFIPPNTGGLTHTKPNYGYWLNSNITEVWIVD